MMGRSHAMSAAALSLTATALSVGPLTATAPAAVIAMYTGVFIGGALKPDLDSNSSTVVKSFGVFGTAMHEVVNTMSLLVYNITRGRADKPRNNGHRTLLHTVAWTLIETALLIAFVGSLSSIDTHAFDLFGKSYSVGSLIALLITGFFIHVGLGGMFDFINSKRKGIGTYLSMLGSLVLTALIALGLPEGNNYWWLGVAAGLGTLTHLAGDFPTKMGIPAFWPLKIRGKRWYDVSLPSFMRFKAGGTVEKAILFPLFSIATVVAGFAVVYQHITSILPL